MTTAPAAAAVLARLRGRGFTIEAASGRLWVSPADRLTGADADTIRRFRDAMLALVAAEDLEAAAEPIAAAAELEASDPPRPRGQIGEHAAAVADGRRRWMADDGSPSPCTECGGTSLRNGTHLCAACWDAWQGARAIA